MELFTVPVSVMKTNCFVILSERGNAAVVDPGGEPEKIIALLEEKGADLRYILLTHGHFDHIGGVRGLQERYPAATVCLGIHEMALIGDPALNQSAATGQPVEEYTGITADRWLWEGDTVQLDELAFNVLETPGHTIGGVCYRLGDTLFTGDTLFKGRTGKFIFPTGNEKMLRESVLRLYRLEGDYTVLNGHTDLTTLEEERWHNTSVHL